MTGGSFRDAITIPLPGGFEKAVVEMKVLIPAMDSDISNATLTTSPTVAEPVLATQRPPAQLTLIVVKGDAIYGATDYCIEGERLLYVLRSGAQGALDLDDVDGTGR